MLKKGVWTSKTNGIHDKAISNYCSTSWVKFHILLSTFSIHNLFYIYVYIKGLQTLISTFDNFCKLKSCSLFLPDLVFSVKFTSVEIHTPCMQAQLVLYSWPSFGMWSVGRKGLASKTNTFKCRASSPFSGERGWLALWLWLKYW